MYYARRSFSPVIFVVLFLLGLLSWCFWFKTDTQMKNEHLVASFEATKKPLLVLSPGKYKVYYDYYKRSRYSAAYPTVHLLDQDTNQLIQVQSDGSWPVSPFMGKSRLELGTFVISRPGSYCITALDRSSRVSSDSLTVTGPLTGK
jgi:hypothetical protein